MLSALIITLLAPPLKCPPDHTVRVTDSRRKVEQCVGTNGQLNGPTRHFHPDGTLALQGQFEATQMTGVWVHYSDLGRKIREETWVKNKRHGPMKTWRDDGSLLADGQNVDGEAHGVLKTFDVDGAVSTTVQMRHGKRHGEMRYLRRSGAVRRIERYVKGRKDGRQEEFFEKGDRLKRVETWQLGERHGPTEHYNLEGERTAREQYRAGRKDGAWQRFRDGRLIVAERFKAGKRHGLKEQYTCPERPDFRTEEEPWLAGQRDGVRIRRNCKTGKVVSKDTFARGDLIESERYRDGVIAHRKIKHVNGPGPKGAHTSRITYRPDGSIKQTVLIMPGGKRETIKSESKAQRRARIKEQVKSKAILKVLGTTGDSNGQIIDVLQKQNSPELDAVLAGATGITTLVQICEQAVRADVQQLKCTRRGSDVDLRNLGQLTALVELDLTRTAIRTLPTIKSGKLKRLALQGTKIKDLRPLARLKSLVYVDLIQTPVTDLSPLLALPKLTDVTLLSSRVPAAQVAAFRKARPNVRVIARFSDLKRR